MAVSHHRMSTDARLNDSELLQSYALHGSEDAFATLVHQYANLVYSAALRQTRDPHAAQEVAQVVFLILARKAARLPKQTLLSGWLWRTTRFVALNYMRKEMHRRQTEENAAAYYAAETEEAWTSMAPLLDEALASLGDKDRAAIILRFFEQRSLHEIAAWLDTSEDAAQKRVARGLDKLRARFRKQGLAVSATVLVGAIGAKSVEAAPAGLAVLLIKGAVHQTGSAAMTADTVLKALGQLRRRTAVLVGAAAALLFMIGVLVVRSYLPGTSFPRRTMPAAVQIAQQMLPGAPVGNVPVRPAVAPNLETVHFVVLDAQTQRPVANAQLSVHWSTGIPYTTSTNLLISDREGRASVQYAPNGEELWKLRVEILKPGFVPKFVNWAAARGDLLEDMPAEYTTTLEPGTVVGGVVVDQDGQPVSGAQVFVEGRGLTAMTSAEREGVDLAHSEVTDSEGKWLCDHLPAEVSSIRLTCSHPDYLSATFGCAKLGATTNSGMIYLAESELRNSTAIVRLQRGLVVAGTVIDAEGQPLTGATVIKNRLWSNSAASRCTDAQGRFRFGDIGPGELVLTARAEGFIESELVIQPTSHKEDLHFTLARASVLRGRILDEQSNAVVHARVCATGESYDQGKHNWRTTSDATGRFEWLSAPPSQTNYEISAWGYTTVNRALVPNGVEQQIILQHQSTSKNWRVAGRVLETNSGKPIEQFQVWVGTVLATPLSSGYQTSVGLAPELRTTGINGRFSFLEVPRYVDRIERLELEVRADGYLTAKTSIPGPLTNQVWLKMELEPSPDLVGTIALADGHAATGVVVLHADRAHTRRGYMQLPGQFDLQLSSAPYTQTDDQGRFVLPSKSMSGILLAVCAQGFAQVDLAGSTRLPIIHLQPWGRLIGTLRVGTQPAANRAIQLGNDYEEPGQPQPFLLARTASTDLRGRFVFEAVPPGVWRLEPHHVQVHVQAGETTEVQLGGGGLRVIGKIALKSPHLPDDLNRLQVALSTKWFPTPSPKRDQFESFQDYNNAMNHWWSEQSQFKSSPAGRESRRNFRTYSANLQTDGTFSIEEVLPGTYDLAIGGDPLHFDPVQISLLNDATTELLVSTPTLGDITTLDVGVVQVDLTPR